MKKVSKTAEDLKTIRRKAGLTQRELAEKCGVSYSLISKYESSERKPSFKTLHKILRCLGHNVPDNYFSSNIDNGLINTTKEDVIFYREDIETMIKQLSPEFLKKVYEYTFDMYRLNQNENR